MRLPSRPAAARDVKYSGLVVGAIGFVLTRTTVGLAAYDTPMSFALGGLVPMAGGLGLSAFGVALAVSSFDAAYVSTVTKWCVLSTGAMVVLAVLTILGDVGSLSASALAASPQLSNFLIGGAVGGALLGVRTAENHRKRRALSSQTERLVTLNRILRHEILNAAAVILGHVGHLEESEEYTLDERAVSVLREKGNHIEATIEEVKFLTDPGENGESLQAVDLRAALEDRIAAMRTTYPDATVTLDGDPDVEVRANAMLGTVFEHLIENAIQHTDAAEVEVCVETTATSAIVTVADDGPGLPDHQQAVVEGRAIAKYDDPTTGFGLNVVRLLVERYGGEVRVDADGTGTEISVELPRADEEDDPFGLTPTRMANAGIASVLAGTTMGAVLQFTTGIIPVIGSLYGVENAIVGWISHEFHSLVFGVVYAAVLHRLRVTGRIDGLPGALAVSVVMGVSLWFLAAGVVMPLWLRLFGVVFPIPNLSVPSLAGHLLWAVLMAVSYRLLCRG